jgi:GDP-L-fucose synthase
MTRYFVAGHRGMVGSAILRALTARREQGAQITVLTRDRDRLDLSNQAQVRAFMQETRPDAVILAAAKVGGIHANATYPAEFIHQNLTIAGNVIHAAHEAGVQQLLQLGSSCIYPRETAQPITERQLLTGPLEPTNEPYAIAKIAAIKLCESYNRQYGRDYRSLMPCNLYGPGDNFHADNAHVIPALMLRCHEARERGAARITIWGSGLPRREFLHVDDLARAALAVLDLPSQRYRAHTDPMVSHVNVGSGQDITIRDLAGLIAGVTGYRGAIDMDPQRPDGTMRKLLDISRIRAMGWAPQITLERGLAATYRWFLDNHALVRV